MTPNAARTTRSVSLLVSVLSVLFAAGALGCGERASTRAPEPTAALPTSSGPSQRALDEGAPNALSPQAIAVAEPTIEPVTESAEALSAPTPELYAEDGLTLRRFALSRSVEGREPIDSAFSFPAAEAPLYAFVDVANANGDERSVRVIFESPTGEQMGMVDLDIPNEVSRWRTWAYSRMITEPGQWEAIVETDEGELLGRISFEIEAT